MRLDRRGSGLVAVAIASYAVIAVPRQINSGINTNDTIYDRSRVVLVGVLTVAGIIAAIIPDRRRRSAYGAGFVISIQLAGCGVVAYRHWLPYFGQSGEDPRHLAVLKSLAVVLALLGLLGSALSVGGMRQLGAFDPRQSTPFRAGLIATAVITLVGMPWLFGYGSHETLDHNSLLGYAALASVPFAASLILAAQIDRRTARSLLLAVAGSAALGWFADDPMKFQFSHPNLPFALVTAVALVVVGVDGRTVTGEQTETMG